MFCNSSFILVLFSLLLHVIYLNTADFPNELFTMESIQKEHIFLRVSEEFSVTSFKKHYYCTKVSLENLKFHLRSVHGSDCNIFVCVDHVMVKAEDEEMFVYLLSSHSSGRSADFLHH